MTESVVDKSTLLSERLRRLGERGEIKMKFRSDKAFGVNKWLVSFWEKQGDSYRTHVCSATGDHLAEALRNLADKTEDRK